eukprot:10511907-Lingulodinium_polyedra.AAC.1
MEEVAALALGPGPLDQASRLAELRTLATNAFSGWGQSKVIEDLLQRLRDAQDRQVTNKTLELQRQWHLMTKGDVIGLHKRQQVQPNPDPVQVHTRTGRTTWSMYTVKGKTPSVDPSSLTRPATWPT